MKYFVKIMVSQDLSLNKKKKKNGCIIVDAAYLKRHLGNPK